MICCQPVISCDVGGHNSGEQSFADFWTLLVANPSPQPLSTAIHMKGLVRVSFPQCAEEAKVLQYELEVHSSTDWRCVELGVGASGPFWHTPTCYEQHRTNKQASRQANRRAKKQRNKQSLNKQTAKQETTYKTTCVFSRHPCQRVACPEDLKKVNSVETRGL